MNRMAVLCLLMLLAACMGRKANPVLVSQEADPEKSCQQLAAELNSIDTTIWRLHRQQEDKGKQNAFFGATASVLLVPALFMDVSDAQAQEIAAWQERKRHLLWIGQQKNCGFKSDAPAP